MSDTTLSRKTFFSGIALPVFSWGLPFHSLVVAVLFGALGFHADTARMLAAWKEIAVLGLLAFVVFRAATGTGPRVTISWIDLAVGALLVIAFAFLVAGESWLRIELPSGAGLYGFRDIAFFLLPYFIGRASPEIADDPDTLRRLYIVAVLTSAIAIVESFAVTPETLVMLGIASYYQDFLNLSAFTNDIGLPSNYYTMIGGKVVHRAGSVYLSSQGFAVPFVIIMPVATAYFVALRRHTLSVNLEYAIIWIGLLLSITRMTIVVCALQVLLILLIARKPELAVAGLAIAVGTLVLALFVVPGLFGFVWETLTWQSGSSLSHSEDWREGFEAFIKKPWGSGLATTDQTATRFNLIPLTGDSGYLKYAVELGMEGLVAHLAIFFGIGLTSLRVARWGTTQTRRLMGTVVLVGTVGVMINAITGVVFNTPVLSYLYFWFAGAVVTIAQKESAPGGIRVSAPGSSAPRDAVTAAFSSEIFSQHMPLTGVNPRRN